MLDIVPESNLWHHSSMLEIAAKRGLDFRMSEPERGGDCDPFKGFGINDATSLPCDSRGVAPRS